MKSPRIYTYKVTFEEIPDWYWGVHKEEKYGEIYLGSPETHAWKWEFYTPHLQICEIFSYTDEGWAEARRVEDCCITPDLNNPLCLNEHVGGLMSLESCRRGAKRMSEMIHAQKDKLGRSAHAVKAGTAAHKEKDELGRSVNGVKRAEQMHKDKDELGRSIHAVKAGTAAHQEKDEMGRSLHTLKLHEERDELGRSVRGVKNAERLNEEKDDLGRSVQGVKNAERLHKDKDEFGRSLTAVKAGTATHKEKDEFGRSVQGVKNGERMHRDKDELGRSVSAVKGGKEAAKNTNTQKWKDPQHPELGEHNPGTLVRMQKTRGYPHSKENRVFVNQGNYHD